MGAQCTSCKTVNDANMINTTQGLYGQPFKSGFGGEVGLDPWFWEVEKVPPGFPEFCVVHLDVAFGLVYTLHEEKLASINGKRSPEMQLLLKEQLQDLWEVLPEYEKELFYNKTPGNTNTTNTMKLQPSTAGRMEINIHSSDKSWMDAYHNPGEPSIASTLSATNQEDVRNWSSIELESWIRRVYNHSNVSQVISQIRANEIDGNTFSMLSKNDLLKLGINEFHVSSIFQQFQSISSRLPALHSPLSPTPNSSVKFIDRQYTARSLGRNTPKSTALPGHVNFYDHAYTAPQDMKIKKSDPIKFQYARSMPAQRRLAPAPVNSRGARLSQFSFIEDVETLERLRKQMSTDDGDVETYEFIYKSLGNPSVRMLNENELSFLFHKYAKHGMVGKMELKSLLQDWISVFDISERVKLTFTMTIHERALKLKRFLDSDRSGKITFDKFRHITNPEIWKRISHQQSGDLYTKKEAETMWKKIFIEFNATRKFSEPCLKDIWDRYENQEVLGVDEFKDLFSDWLNTLQTYNGGKPESYYSFRNLDVKSTNAIEYLDTSRDGIINCEEFLNIKDEAFWSYIDEYSFSNNERYVCGDSEMSGWAVMLLQSSTF